MSILVKYVYAPCVWKRFKETLLKIFTFPGSLIVGDKIYALIEPRLADVCEVSWRKSFSLFM